MVKTTLQARTLRPDLRNFKELFVRKQTASYWYGSWEGEGGGEGWGGGREGLQ